MKKIFLVILTFVLFTGIAFSQISLNIGVGPTVLFPSGDFGNAYNTGYGGVVQGEVGVLSISGIATIGYLSFSGKDNNPTLSNIPVLVGAKYKLSMGLYAKAQIGFNNFSASSYSVTKFGYLAGVGLDLIILDVSAQFQNLGSYNTIKSSVATNTISITALYKFGL